MQGEPLDFYDRGRLGYFAVAKAHPGRVKILSAAGNIDQTAGAIWAEVAKTFGL